jgi:NAD(P)-dependent dehydrogenase (short-subunit alcohol dehydrogenase family)
MAASVSSVTGVSRGIGSAIVKEMQARGAAVVGAARRVADVPATAGLLPAPVTTKLWPCFAAR